VSRNFSGFVSTVSSQVSVTGDGYYRVKFYFFKLTPTAGDGRERRSKKEWKTAKKSSCKHAMAGRGGDDGDGKFHLILHTQQQQQSVPSAVINVVLSLYFVEQKKSRKKVEEF